MSLSFVELATEVGQMAQSAYYHQKETERAKLFHQETIELEKKQHSKDIQLIKQTYLMDVFLNLEQHFQQLNAGTHRLHISITNFI